jgi:hypothetical protein
MPLSSSDLSDDDLQQVIGFLVGLTVDPNQWQDFKTQIGSLKDDQGPAKAKELLLDLPGIPDPDSVLKVVDEYCDRLFAGVDGWDEADRLRWVQVCQMVTELTSSVQ